MAPQARTEAEAEQEPPRDSPRPTRARDLVVVPCPCVLAFLAEAGPKARASTPTAPLAVAGMACLTSAPLEW